MSAGSRYHSNCCSHSRITKPNPYQLRTSISKEFDEFEQYYGIQKDAAYNLRKEHYMVDEILYKMKSMPKDKCKGMQKHTPVYLAGRPIDYYTNKLNRQIREDKVTKWQAEKKAETLPVETPEELANQRMDWKNYHRLEVIHRFLDELEYDYPSICTAGIIGKSLEGRDLKILKISNSNASNDSVWIDAGIHAREWIAPAVNTYVANHIAKHFDSLPNSVRNKDWYFLPVFNPDGYEYAHTVNRMWRKNKAHVGNKMYGVDLNRNFSVGWGGKGSSDDPTHAMYRGPHPFSEPETAAVRNIFKKSGVPFKVYITLHSFGEVIVMPYSYREGLAPDYIRLLQGATAMSKAIYNTNGNTYKVGISRDVMYQASGTSNDWSHKAIGIPFCYLIELRSKKHKFMLPEEEIAATGAEILNCLIALMEFIDNYEPPDIEKVQSNTDNKVSSNLEKSQVDKDPSGIEKVSTETEQRPSDTVKGSFIQKLPSIIEKLPLTAEISTSGIEMVPSNIEIDTFDIEKISSHTEMGLPSIENVISDTKKLVTEALDLDLPFLSFIPGSTGVMSPLYEEDIKSKNSESIPEDKSDVESEKAEENQKEIDKNEVTVLIGVDCSKLNMSTSDSSFKSEIEIEQNEITMSLSDKNTETTNSRQNSTFCSSIFKHVEGAKMKSLSGGSKSNIDLLRSVLDKSIKVAPAPLENTQVWEVKFTKEGERHFVKSLDTAGAINIWREENSTMDIMVEGPRAALVAGMLHERELPFSIAVPDVVVLYERERGLNHCPNNPNRDPSICDRMDWKNYHRLDTIYSFMDNLAAEYPYLCKVIVIGKSAEGRDIKLLKISNGVEENMGVWIDGAIHAREWISPAVVTYLADQIVRNFIDQPECVSNKDWYILPVLNPDGYEYTHTTDRMWRKNRAPYGECVGVDLNRNWSQGWGEKGEEGSSDDPGNIFFRGSKPFSEPETAAVKDTIMKSNTQFIAFLSFHSYGEAIIFPWGYTSEPCPDYVLLLEGGTAMAKAIHQTSGHTYKVGSTKDLMYYAAGTSTDWSYSVPKIPYSYMVELRGKQHRFLLPKEEIIETGSEVLSGVQRLLSFIDGKCNGSKSQSCACPK